MYIFWTRPNGPDRTEGIKLGPDRIAYSVHVLWLTKIFICMQSGCEHACVASYCKNQLSIAIARARWDFRIACMHVWRHGATCFSACVREFEVTPDL